jgi:hypothetical protein
VNGFHVAVSVEFLKRRVSNEECFHVNGFHMTLSKSLLSYQITLLRILL